MIISEGHYFVTLLFINIYIYILHINVETNTDYWW